MPFIYIDESRTTFVKAFEIKKQVLKNRECVNKHSENMGTDKECDENLMTKD